MQRNIHTGKNILAVRIIRNDNIFSVKEKNEADARGNRPKVNITGYNL